MAGSNGVLRVAAVMSALPAMFFTYYTVRLIYVNVAVAGAAEHRQAGMYIGFVAFPVLAILFGAISWRFWKRAARR
jgi:hypothetical protein